MKCINKYLKNLKNKFIYILISLIITFQITQYQQVAYSFPSHNFNTGQKQAAPTDIKKSVVAEINPAELLTRGKRLYEGGQYREAIATLQSAAEIYQRDRDFLGQALIGIYLANIYQELGHWEDAQQAIFTSGNLLNNLEQTTNKKLKVEALLLNTWGHIQFDRGQNAAALETWQEGEKIYSQISDIEGILGSKINQAEALQQLGMYRRSQQTLTQIEETLAQMPASPIKALGLRSFGISLYIMGSWERSQQALETSLAISQQLNRHQFRNADEISATLIALGNTSRALKQPEVAQKYYQQAATIATTTIGKLEVQINQLSLFIETEKLPEAIALLPHIESLLSSLPLSRFSIYAQVNFASKLIKIIQIKAKHYQVSQANINNQNQLINLKEIALILAQAVQGARNLEDIRAESYALKQLGSVYEQAAQWTDASQMTEQAIIQAEKIQAQDIIALAQWQLGRIHKQQGNIPEAIAAYTSAFQTLKSLRKELVAAGSELQFSFQDTVEPIYRELVALLLTNTNYTATHPRRLDALNYPENISTHPAKNLQQAREIIEALNLAELDNFFRNSCVEVFPEQIDQVDPSAAVIYPIILPDRLGVILSLPGQRFSYYETHIPAHQVENILKHWLKSLNPAYDNVERLRISQQIYNWLIQPAAADLATNDIKTLVFVLDGFLRNLPMAALYDGQQYLIEKYTIAVAPGLQLLSPRSLRQTKLQVLSGGLSKPRQNFAALPGVELEIEQIAANVDGEIILNQNFTKVNLKSRINRSHFPIVHLATHGQFSSNPEQTFLLTWDGKINVQELDELLRPTSDRQDSQIELLVLSACQTALGDNRAALGLAGVAVRSGARSTLATLWSVSDESTVELMSEFYRAIATSKVSKAEALRQAQIAVLKNSQFQHPFFWAPFVLIGNWL
ncbi:CHAT domain-containing protein [Planktothricoides raciborskii]|uniref:CHAT domain-containing protein n=1 Tax=Planktothricoides raciborskii GIHE-MW2 TaxID=2792601 RepID=A0AAU8J9A3_9CYAN